MTCERYRRKSEVCSAGSGIAAWCGSAAATESVLPHAAYETVTLPSPPAEGLSVHGRHADGPRHRFAVGRKLGFGEDFVLGSDLIHRHRSHLASCDGKVLTLKIPDRMFDG